MHTVTSYDGTTITFDRVGDGHPVVLVGGGPTDRSAHAPLAALLAARYTVYNYDRRGRGASGDTAPYAVDREYEDLEALIDTAGGGAHVFGSAAGAFLALEAAARGLAITRLALWEPPYVLDGSTPTRAAADASAHTFGYDALIAGDFRLPTRRLAAVTVPVLVLDGGTTPWLSRAARAVAAALPDAEHRTLAGQPHDADPAVLAPPLRRFFTGGSHLQLEIS